MVNKKLLNDSSFRLESYKNRRQFLEDQENLKLKEL